MIHCNEMFPSDLILPASLLILASARCEGKSSIWSCLSRKIVPESIPLFEAAVAEGELPENFGGWNSRAFSLSFCSGVRGTGLAYRRRDHVSQSESNVSLLIAPFGGLNIVSIGLDLNNYRKSVECRVISY